MPKASTFGALIASQVVDSDSVPLLTNAGDNKRVSIQEMRTVVGPGWSLTINAANEAGATDEIKIQAAITHAAGVGAERVFVPSSMLPYDASLITYNVAVQMVREGGSFDVYDIDAYGASPAATDAINTLAIQAAIDGATMSGGGVVHIPVGAYLFISLDLTGIDSYGPLQIIGEGQFASLLRSVNLDGNAIDCTGSQNIGFRDFNLYGADADGVTGIPNVGFLLARRTDQLGYKHRFTNVGTGGKFKKAGVFAYAAEECRFNNCQFINGYDGAATFWSTIDNAGSGEGVTSAFETIYVGAISNSENSFVGTTFYAIGSGNADCVRLRGARNLHLSGAFFYNLEGRAIVYVDNDGQDTSDVNLIGFRVEEGSTVDYGVYFAGTSVCTGWTISGGIFDSDVKDIYAVDNSRMQMLHIDMYCSIDVFDLDYAVINSIGAVAIRGTAHGCQISSFTASTTIAVNDDTTLFSLDEGFINSEYGLYHDRGDPSDYDFYNTDVTIDGTWYDLDLTAKGVPTGAKTVALSVILNYTVANKRLRLRKKGNSNEINVGQITTQVANQSLFADVIVPCDTGQVVQYNADSGTNNALQITVKGWWF